MNRADVASCQSLKFLLGQLARVNDHTALAAAKGQVDARTLERHPERQGPHLTVGDIQRKANASLGRAARVVVHAAIAGEDLERAVIHAHRNGDGEHLLGMREPQHSLGMHTRVWGSGVQSGKCGLKDVVLSGRHGTTISSIHARSTNASGARRENTNKNRPRAGPAVNARFRNLRVYAPALASPLSRHSNTLGQSSNFITPSGGSMRRWYGPWPQ